MRIIFMQIIYRQDVCVDIAINKNSIFGLCDTFRLHSPHDIVSSLNKRNKMCSTCRQMRMFLQSWICWLVAITAQCSTGYEHIEKPHKLVLGFFDDEW